MRLLVTGGAGYIGSVVAARLLDAGHEVVVFDSLLTGKRSAVPEEARFVCGDLLDGTKLKSVLADGFDGVLHFAALSLVGESVERPGLYYRNNVCGTLNLLDAMVENDVRRLIFSSTAAVYGEPDELPITETAPTRPANPYGASKLAVDQMIGFYATAHKLAATSLRYFNVAGASGRLGWDINSATHLISTVLRVAIGLQRVVEIYGADYPTEDGTAIRDYVHVEDLAQAHLLALEEAEAGQHRIYNLGNGAGFSVLQVIEAARQVTEKSIEAIEGPRRSGDPAVVVASSEKACRELGWRPAKQDLVEIISDAWNWTLAYPGGYEPKASLSENSDQS